MSEIKRQVLPQGLWVVATPIGNLGDLTPRAEKALKSADAILCEDTRRTGRLFSALKISQRLERFDAHTTPGRVRQLVECMLEGQSFALVTDAGTPGISDPGAALVAAARKAGVVVTPIPGPSAVITLLSVAGFLETPFVFRGFFPRKTAERKEEIEQVRASGLANVFVWFESPERIDSVLEAVAKNLPDAKIVAAKELTKLHEKIFSGEAEEISAAVHAEIVREGAIGEWCFAICLPEGRERGEESSDWVKTLRCLLDARVSASDAARQVSQHFGAPKKQAYEEALKLSGKK